MDGDDLETLRRAAIAYARDRNFGADALSVNARLTQLATADEGGWTRLAHCHLELRDWAAAEVALERVLPLNPQNTIARNMTMELSRRRQFDGI